MCPQQVRSFLGDVYVSFVFYVYKNGIMSGVPFYVLPFFLKTRSSGFDPHCPTDGLPSNRHMHPSPFTYSEGRPSLLQSAATAHRAARNAWGVPPASPVGTCAKVYSEAWGCWVTGTCRHHCFKSWHIAPGRAAPCMLR